MLYNLLEKAEEQWEVLQLVGLEVGKASQEAQSFQGKGNTLLVLHNDLWPAVCVQDSRWEIIKTEHSWKHWGPRVKADTPVTADVPLCQGMVTVGSWVCGHPLLCPALNLRHVPSSNSENVIKEEERVKHICVSVKQSLECRARRKQDARDWNG